ncbi:homeobox-DDT domain protein RLT1 isoform X7 [Medicago truncatula]|uniref:homeobox-DDT domain protein RLT1 isoform X7 n=1 Tax=Medicago truncatula TaxID=3880 RepID=UPI000D2F156F|nr:homeobox-DDT domain protein RLT1 isoform X7 [Medicago truncatula]
MEGEGSSEGESDRKRGGADDGKIAVSTEGQSKPKRQMKTPFQLETLEKAYALDNYPSEPVRIDLSEKLGLTDRQLQMWFCHRRLKDKKESAPKKVVPPRKPVVQPLPDSPVDDHRMGFEHGNEYDSGSGSGSSPGLEPRNAMALSVGYYESPHDEMELKAIACVEDQLGEPLREDAPIIGVEFDPLPPDAFGALIVTERQKRPRLAYDGKIYGRHDVKTDKGDDAKITRDVEGHELEKHDSTRRKNEERVRKEMERQDRERRKEEERLMRERQREEERSKREEKREIERREKYLLKENIKAERIRQKEELRKEKEEERRKAALEKATARKIAKESLELIEDEQLEMMELAASSKGLSSIIRLDFDTLQNIESFRDSLCLFPPESVKLRKPFAIQPWINSEDNVGNLLMVWRFLITFADVLELWPFTLDEFVQAFHDYDSRLLGEIHVALLKVIIKDIEDVARTPCTGLGMNQNGAANSGGGHPEIVEGAYAWGFDIRNWHKHLNQLTWPEIFRQLALSAGYGPQFKKRSITSSRANSKDEGRSSEDIISTLRNGSAAQNALTKMQERGLLGPRRSRHRLTPGTVKFAAYHVLSLEDGKGLNVIELAEKIQKSGLRDLSTSKTPEASISVALTRDAKLFERVAPSTYCVRAAFRKDPADAESILSEARKKIQIFENGFLAEEDAEDVEREESESEVDEDPEVDDLVNPSTVNKTSEPCNDFSSSGKENLGHDGELKDGFDKDLPGFPDNGSKNADCPSGQPVACESLIARNLGEDNIEVDESKSGESWIQGLTEGEYSDLSVEERLNALVVLVGLANEGNLIRVVLEDRLEAANALKKQMLAEAQIDKIRLKDDNVNKSDFPSINGIRVETPITCAAAEGNQSPLLDINICNNNNEESPSKAENKRLAVVGQSLSEKLPSVQDLCIGPDNPQTPLSAQYSKRSRSQLKSFISHLAEEMYIYRSLPLGQDRRHNRYWQFVASASCNDPGSGRIFVEYHDGKWRLIDSEEAFDALLNSLDSRGIRESHLRLMLLKIENIFKENVQKNAKCAKIGNTDEICVKNEAEETDSSPDHHTRSDSPSSTLCGLSSDTSETSASFTIELGKSESDKKASLRRYQDFQKWMWKECYNPSILCAMKYGKKRCKPQVDICDICLNLYCLEDSHCSYCHLTFPSNDGFDFSKHVIQCGDKSSKDISIFESPLPLRTRLLKALLAFIEVSVPPEAFQSVWTEDIRRLWGVKLSRSSSAEELLQMLTLFERALKRDFLSSPFSTTGDLLGMNAMSESAAHTSMDLESVTVLPWVPRTTSAVSLRLFELDTSITYLQLEKPEPCEEKEARFIKLPSRYASVKSTKVVEPVDLDHDEFMKVKSAPLKIVQSSKKRRRLNQDKGRDKKLSKRTSHSKRDNGHHNFEVTENLSQRIKQQGQGSQGQTGGRGPRTIRKRREEKRAVEDLSLGHKAANNSSNIGREQSRILDEDWDDEKASPMRPIQMEAADMSSSSEEIEYDDNAQAVESDDNVEAVEYGQGNWEIGFNGTPNRWNRDLVGMSEEEDVEASEDDNDNGIEGNEEEEEGSEADVMSQGSDRMANRVVKEESLDSSDSEDSFD